MKVKASVSSFQEVVVKGGLIDTGVKEFMSKEFMNFIEGWKSTMTQISEHQKMLPESFASSFKLQQKINELNLKTVLASKAVDAVSSATKRLQSAGG